MLKVARKNNQRGDTIVEVLICIIVISTILAGAFVVSNQSLQAVRDSNERAQAVKIAESQIEEMRATSLAGVTSNFCNTYAAVNPLVVTTSSDSNCYFDKNGSPAISTDMASATQSTSGPTTNLYAYGKGVLYKVIVSRQGGAPLPGQTALYKVEIKWVTTKSKLGTLSTYYRIQVL